jgi:hypothetical protein
LSPGAPEFGPAPRFDVGRILEALDRHGVSYLIVGGIAATIHGATRQITDFDCLPARTPVNLRRLAAALTGRPSTSERHDRPGVEGTRSGDR